MIPGLPLSQIQRENLTPPVSPRQRAERARPDDPDAFVEPNVFANTNAQNVSARGTDSPQGTPTPRTGNSSSRSHRWVVTLPVCDDLGLKLTDRVTDKDGNAMLQVSKVWTQLRPKGPPSVPGGPNSGAVEWNLANPSQSVQRGDRIVSVNNSRGGARDLVKLIKAARNTDTLVILFERSDALTQTLESA
jgi:hypothetical protein